MIAINKSYESIFDRKNLDKDCEKIAQEISFIGDQIEKTLDADKHKQAVTMYLQLLKSMTNHFVEDEHYDYFDDLYSPEYEMQHIYDSIIRCEIGEEVKSLLDAGHQEIMESECYQDYGTPSYLRVL